MKRSGWILLALCVLAYGWMSARAEALDADKQSCVRDQDWDQGIRSCSQVLTRGNAESERNRAVAYVNRGIAYYRKGDYGRAIADFDQAIRIDPKFKPAYDNRSAAYEKKGDRDRAIADVMQGGCLEPIDLRNHADNGVDFEPLSDEARARAALDAALTGPPPSNQEALIAKLRLACRAMAAPTPAPAPAR
jgi:tetratricopeptide (TPR) repeat protein